MENKNITAAEQTVDEINLIMDDYQKNKNEIGLLYNEYTIQYGKEYYLANLANSLLNSFNTFEKFYAVVEDQKKLALSLKEISVMGLDILKMDTEQSLGKMSIFKKKRIVKKEYPLNKEKITALLNKIDEISNFLTESVKIK